ncbi:MAG TPA: type II secretion system F family protein [Vicinamibacterales bacterium]|nr:type II secretion system F family protein [Vicinamibacterales bacterium]
MLLLLPLLAFAFASLLIAAAAMAYSSGHAVTLEQRLVELGGARSKAPAADGGFDKVVDTLKRVGNALPRSTAEMGKLRTKLVRAGYRGHEAVAVFFGIRLAFALLCFWIFATPMFMRPNMAMALAGCGLGYLLPGMALGRMAGRRQHRIRMGLADALDLLVVSVEAGLGLDQAIQRVGEEIAFAHQDLSDELRLVNLELRAGKGRTDSLRGLAERTGVDDLASLVAMLVQTDRFGTSVAQSLRVHSETLRTKRRQRAEEAAAKTGVKMVFPLVFCIFPAIFVVTIGPAAIKFVQVLGPMSQK